MARAAELVSDATRRLYAAGGNMPRPVISSACPAVLRLIRVRFPELIDHVLPLVAPVELAARLAKREAVESTGLPAGEDRGCIFHPPARPRSRPSGCPWAPQKSAGGRGGGHPGGLPPAARADEEAAARRPLATAGRIGIGWAESGGESRRSADGERYLAADGIENVIRVLEDLEDEKYPGLDFVELDACAGGCVGGVLQVENPYIAKAKLKTLRRYMPVSKNHLGKSIPVEMLWDKDLVYAPVLELGETRAESFARYSQLQQILEQLPGLDCGSCGAPTCQALAEDVVRGAAEVEDCVVLLRRRMEALLRDTLGEKVPQPEDKKEE